MKLHRANSKPDWELVAPNRRTMWQRIAAQTHGIVTPGNMFSTVGLVLVGMGLAYVRSGRLRFGLALMTFGRLCDLADGMAAERTGTKSLLGEAVDASFDKLAALATLVVFAASGVMPWWFALLIGLQNGTTALLTAIGKSMRLVVHPVAAGKFGGAVEWAALLVFVLSAATQGTAHSVLAVAAYVLAFISIGLNAAATAWYARTIVAQRGQLGR